MKKKTKMDKRRRKKKKEKGKRTKSSPLLSLSSAFLFKGNKHVRKPFVLSPLCTLTAYQLMTRAGKKWGVKLKKGREKGKHSCCGLSLPPTPLSNPPKGGKEKKMRKRGEKKSTRRHRRRDSFTTHTRPKRRRGAAYCLRRRALTSSIASSETSVAWTSQPIPTKERRRLSLVEG